MTENLMSDEVDKQYSQVQKNIRGAAIASGLADQEHCATSFPLVNGQKQQSLLNAALQRHILFAH
jgi:hypothetical protein